MNQLWVGLEADPRDPSVTRIVCEYLLTSRVLDSFDSRVDAGRVKRGSRVASSGLEYSPLGSRVRPGSDSLRSLILGHFIKDCPIRMLLENSGEIYKPAGTRNYCFRNGTPLHQRDSEGRNPFEQVKKLQQESPRPAQAAAPAPAPRIQNYTSQEDEWFTPSRTQEPVGLIPLEDDQETQSGFQ
ncbi:hypothetical protein BDZ89DRAFT_1033355 [Hymenopellis radicata]|nr:hypothetical protein BDZ89DRAFT_1033355 [Hymenopellis radicata]